MGIKAYNRGSASIRRQINNATRGHDASRDARDIIRRFLEGHLDAAALFLFGFTPEAVSTLCEDRAASREAKATAEAGPSVIDLCMAGEVADIPTVDLETVYRECWRIRARRFAVAELRRRRRVKRLGSADAELAWRRKTATLPLTGLGS